MIKNWGVIGGIAAAIAAGVYVLWGPITERKKRKRGKNPYAGVICELLSAHWLTCSVLCFFRYGSRSVELGQHLLPEFFAAGFSRLSVLHQMVGEIFGFTHYPVMQRQPAVCDTASASQRYNQPVP